MDGSAGALHIEVAGLQRLVIGIQRLLIRCTDATLGNEVGCLAGLGEGRPVAGQRRLAVEPLRLDDLLDGVVCGVLVELELSGQVLPVDRVGRLACGYAAVALRLGLGWLVGFWLCGLLCGFLSGVLLLLLLLLGLLLLQLSLLIALPADSCRGLRLLACFDPSGVLRDALALRFPVDIERAPVSC